LKKALREQDDLQRQDIAKILHWAYNILPICYALIAFIRIITEGWPTVISMITASILIIPAKTSLKKGQIETSLVILVISLILVITVAITYANGIHDIGLLAFPIILLISSLMLRTWQQFVGFGLVIVSIIWLALGEGLGFYQPTKVESGSWSELIIILLIIIASAMICHKIGFALKKALFLRDSEMQLTSNKIRLLQQSLNQKIAITNQMHVQIADSISIIRELLRHQQNQPLKNLPNQLLAIELVHSELNRLELEKELDLENYIDALKLQQPDIFKDLKKSEMDDVMVNVDKAMSLGMLLTELALNNELKGRIRIQKQLGKVTVGIDELSTPLEISMLADIVIRQLSAKIINEESMFHIILEQSTESGNEEI
jgi:hypothetical protein